MAGRKRNSGGSRGRVNAQTIALRRDPATGILMQVGPDRGTEERKQQQGGVEETTRSIGIVSVKGVFAKATGPWEALVGSGALGHGDALARRQDAASSLRQLALRAGLYKSPTALYGVRTSAGVGEESDRMADARELLARRAARMGAWGFWMLMDILVLDKAPPPARVPEIVACVDIYAAVVRLVPAETTTQADDFVDAVTDTPAERETSAAH